MAGRSFYEGLLKKLHIAAAKSEDDLLSVMADNPLPLIRSPNKRQRASFSCDIISTCMLPEDEYDQLIAAFTFPDGNCMYNAVSMHLVGDSKLAAELRCRTIYEMFENNARYMSMHESCMYYDEPNHDYIAKMCSDRSYSGVLEIAACSNVIGADIHVVYPEVNPQIRPYFHRTFEPELYFLNSTPMRIMLTQAGSMSDQKATYWAPNHFVYLVPPKLCRGHTCWPSQRDKWLEVKKGFEEIKDTLENAHPQTIDLSSDELLVASKDESPKSNLITNTASEEHIAHVNICNTSSSFMTYDKLDGQASELCFDEVVSKEDKRKDYVYQPNNGSETKLSVDTCGESSTITTNTDRANVDTDLAPYADLLAYGVQKIGINENAKVNVMSLKSSMKGSSDRDIIYIASRTTQPPSKSWGKYSTVRRASSTVKVELLKRRCRGSYVCKECQNCTKNKKTLCCGSVPELMECHAELMYIIRTDGTGTLIVQKGKHSLLCAQKINISIIDKNSYDGILDYFGHSTERLISAKHISDLNEADGEQMYVIQNKQLPADTKPPGRPWKHACSYKTKYSGVWHVKQRKCTDCPAILRYIRSNNIDECLIQHIGRHRCRGQRKGNKNTVVSLPHVGVKTRSSDCKSHDSMA